jgi:8-oxo-dGTP pyrophosphatase MutT (NUDIX family)
MIAAGIFFYCITTKRYLYLLRSDYRNWALPGGKVEDNETFMEAIVRECREEMGYFPENGKIIPIQKFVNNKFVYNTFFCAVDNEFIPQLNSEHCGYAWVEDRQYPKPLHPGLFNTINFDIVQSKLVKLTNQNALLNDFSKQTRDSIKS